MKFLSHKLKLFTKTKKKNTTSYYTDVDILRKFALIWKIEALRNSLILTQFTS